MLSITEMRIDGASAISQESPRLVDRSALVLDWAAKSAETGDAQAEYEISVSLCGREIWASGAVSSPVQRATLSGLTLPEGERARVKLSIKSVSGERATAEGECLLARVDWRAKWIGARDAEYGAVSYLRREFTVKKPLAQAILYSAAAGYQRVSIDGARVSRALLDPAHTDYSKTCQYSLTQGIKLSEGAHCLGATLAQGWRRNSAVAFKRVGREVTFAGLPEYSAMLKLVYQDGEIEWILTDETWEIGRGGIVFSDIFEGEAYDAGKTVPGWDMPGFTGFAPADALDAPGGKMEPMLIPPITEHELIKPFAIWRLDADTEIVDFGRNAAGVIRLRLPEMTEGQTIELRHAEVTDEAGDLYLEPLRGAVARDTYTASGDARDLAIFQPEFTYHGFRYARVRGLGRDICEDDIALVALRTDIEERSRLVSGSALCTAIHRACVNTEKSNMHSILTDCPNRNERQGWMNDATVRFEEIPYNFDAQRMFRKVVRDIEDAQGCAGEITCTAPFVYGKRPGDPVCSSYLIAAWQSYMHYGDAEIIERGWDGFCAWEDFLLSKSEGFIVNYGYYGDWAGPAYACVTDGGVCARSTVTPNEFMSTGYSYYNCVLLEKFARILGREADAQKYGSLALDIRRAMLDKWYDARTARFATGSQGCQAFAAWLGIFPDSDEARAVLKMRDELVASGYQFTTGNLCTRYMLDALTRHGYKDTAWSLYTRESYPSLGYMLQNEATTIWERFELKKDPAMNSHNHPMFGAADYWLWAWIIGLRPTAPGFREFEIRPNMPGELLSIQATLKTIRGEISVRIVRRYGAVHLMVTVPFGCVARIELGRETRAVGSGYHVMCAREE